MKTLELKLDFSTLNLSEEDKKNPESHIIGEVIKTVILGYSQQVKGLNQLERKQYYNICDSLEKAEAEKLNSAEFVDTDMGFLRRCFRETKLTPNNLLRQVETLIENVK